MRTLMACATGVILGLAGLCSSEPSHTQEQVSSYSGRSQQAAAQHPTEAPPAKSANRIEYRNTHYGFCYSLPGGWTGYSIRTDEWQGDGQGPKGPIIVIRHPQWTPEDPRQDIPIMVFTQAQWRLLKREKFFVSAAPFGPTELGRNHKYVFALPPRFDYAFPTGYEEVEEIVKSKPLRAPCRAR